MKLVDRTLNTIKLALFFVLGVSVAKIVQNFPIIKIDGNINLVSLSSLMLTAFLGVFIPLYFKKLIDDNSNIKQFLSEELKEIITLLVKVKTNILGYKIKGSISDEEKDELVYIFNDIELKINSFSEQIEISFPLRGKKFVDEIKEEYLLYEAYLFSGEFMEDSFLRIGEDFFYDHNNKQNKLVTHLKKAIHQIYKF